ncbi:MAG: RluA family pseudouridine synthase [Clostridia bacterium]|nr:RluA family pseudouridine synthase [Clostridia bacterium]
MDKRLYVAEENCKRLDLFLSGQTEEFTRSRFKKMIDDGQVTVNGKKAKAGVEIKVGDEIALEIPDAVAYDVKAENIPIDIVYQDDDLAVVNKPQGMTVHIGNGNVEGTLVNALLYSLDKLSGIGGVLRPGIVHRIDKDTSGLLVVAKNDRAHVSLAKQIAEKSCHRIYYALLEGNLKTDSGRVVTDIGRHPTERTKMTVLPDGTGRIAVTDYEVLVRFGADYTLCKFILQTGRTHQIRVHAKHLGNPVVGDPVYGYKKQKFSLNGQLLHAKTLELTHPTTGERMSFDAPLPPYFSEILEKLSRQYKVEIER